MASLTKISITARKTIRYGIYLIIFLIVGRVFLNTGIKMFKKIKTEDNDDVNTRKRLTVEDLIPGDHIYVRRRGLIYSHHGIYAGERTVINFKGEDKEKRDPTIILTEIESFLKGGKLRRRNYQKHLPHFESLRIARENLS